MSQKAKATTVASRYTESKSNGDPPTTDENRINFVVPLKDFSLLRTLAVVELRQ